MRGHRQHKSSTTRTTLSTSRKFDTFDPHKFDWRLANNLMVDHHCLTTQVDHQVKFTSKWLLIHYIPVDKGLLTRELSSWVSSIVVSKPKTSDFLGQNKITYSFVLFEMDNTPCIPLNPIISQLSHHSIDIITIISHYVGCAFCGNSFIVPISLPYLCCSKTCAMQHRAARKALSNAAKAKAKAVLPKQIWQRPQPSSHQWCPRLRRRQHQPRLQCHRRLLCSQAGRQARS